jgi:hypothetical protein
MQDIIKELGDVGTSLFNKFGTDSYEIRCAIFDIRERLRKIETVKPVESCTCKNKASSTILISENKKGYTVYRDGLQLLLNGTVKDIDALKLNG